MEILGTDGEIDFLAEETSKYEDQCKHDSEVFLFSVQKGIRKTQLLCASSAENWGKTSKNKTIFREYILSIVRTKRLNFSL